METQAVIDKCSEYGAEAYEQDKARRDEATTYAVMHGDKGDIRQGHGEAPSAGALPAQYPPGKGKGTQAKYLVKKLGNFQISTGDMLREEIQKNSEIGKRIVSDMDNGNFVSDIIFFHCQE